VIRVNRRIRRKAFPVPLHTRNFKLTGLVSNPNLYGERPATKRWAEKQNQPELLTVALPVYGIKCNYLLKQTYSVINREAQQDRQCTCNVTLRRVRVTNV
jgi:hypothetical protein